MPDQRRDPDYLLAPQNDPGLNETFYRARPDRYFNQRLEALLLVAGNSDGLAALLEQGVTVGKLKAGGAPRARLTEDELAEVQEDRERFAIAETEILRHHAAETLLRLYFAHEDLPPCPWLVLAKERSPGEFKRKVEKLGDELWAGEERRAKLARVFFGVAERAQLTPTPTEETWSAAVENIATWLSFYAAHFLDAEVYNATKHGLAVQAGESAFHVGEEAADEAVLARSGWALEYVALSHDQTGRRRWRRTIQWVDLDEGMAHIFMAARLIRDLMDVARARYTGAPLSRLDLSVPGYEQVSSGKGIQVNKLSIDLLYFAEPGESGAASGR